MSYMSENSPNLRGYEGGSDYASMPPPDSLADFKRYSLEFSEAKSLRPYEKPRGLERLISYDFKTVLDYSENNSSYGLAA